MASLKSGEPRMWNRIAFDSEEKIESYFIGMAGLLEDIRANGYRMRPLPDLGLLGAFRPSSVRSLLEEAEERHIGVALDADGALLRLGPGQHRLAAAQLLGVPEVPVEVRLLHVDVLCAATERAVRDAIRRIGKPAAFAS